MRLFDYFRLRTGLFAPSDDEGPTDWNAEPDDINLVDADEPPSPIGDDLSSQPPPAEAA
jgi:hypothetical protein